MILRLHTFLAGLLALLMAALLALAPVTAKPVSGGYQLFEGAASGDQVAISLASLENFYYHAKIAPECCNAANTALPNVPGRVQSRVNLATGDKNSGWTHVVGRHFNADKNASQFTVSQNDLRMTLLSPDVVNSPVTRTLESAAHGTLYVREVDLGSPIGTDKFNSFQPTSTMTVMTDRFGNLVTATPGVVP